MKTTLLRWLLVMALANWFVFQTVEWVNSYLVYSYQKRRIHEDSHQMVASEIPRFDLLPAAQWEEATRTFHQRWQTPAKLSSLEQYEWMVWRTTEYFESRVQYDYSFPGGAFAYVLLKDKNTILEIGPLPGLTIVTMLDNLVAIGLWLLINGGALSWLMLGWFRRARAVERATSAFLADGSARLIDDDSGDSLGQAARSVNRMASRAEQLLHQRQQMIHEQRELLHAVAHECRAPLARLSFALEMLAHAESVAARQPLVRDMENGISELDGLVRELLTYARLQHGAQKLEMVETDVAGVVDDVIAKTKTLYPAVVFQTAGAEADYRPVLDNRLFARCLTNLVRNAASFAHASVRVSWAFAHGVFELRVADDGPGIPMEQRERVFEPFVRLDPSRSRDSGGAGLGLAIVKGISERHKGEVLIEDSASGGACFILRWPLNA